MSQLARKVSEVEEVLIGVRKSATGLSEAKEIANAIESNVSKLIAKNSALITGSEVKIEAENQAAPTNSTKFSRK